MKTAELIAFLARGAGAAPRIALRPWLAASALGGGLLAAGAALALIGPIPAAMFGTAAPWIKFGYALALAAGAISLSERLARPLAAAPRRGVAMLLAAAAAMSLLAAQEFVSTPEALRAPAALGHSWTACPWIVLVLSLPTLAALFAVLRRGAPTRPRAAGFAAGLLAGATGAFGYAFACNEGSSVFVALWYTLGIALAGGLGAMLGPRLLRW